VRIYIKGAPEIVVRNCENHYTGSPAATATGETYKQADKVPLDEGTKEDILRVMNEKMTQHSLRAIAFSYRDMNVSDFENMMAQMNGEIDSADEIS
jgi:magnesium-transporting ATPase (P-type)